jgi:hypothetical protein
MTQLATPVRLVAELFESTARRLATTVETGERIDWVLPDVESGSAEHRAIVQAALEVLLGIGRSVSSWNDASFDCAVGLVSAWLEGAPIHEEPARRVEDAAYRGIHHAEEWRRLRLRLGERPASERAVASFVRAGRKIATRKLTARRLRAADALVDFARSPMPHRFEAFVYATSRAAAATELLAWHCDGAALDDAASCAWVVAAERAHIAQALPRLALEQTRRTVSAVEEVLVRDAIPAYESSIRRFFGWAVGPRDTAREWVSDGDWI